LVVEEKTPRTSVKGQHIAEQKEQLLKQLNCDDLNRATDEGNILLKQVPSGVQK